MTTIASDGRTVAADGLVTAGDEPLRADKIKIHRGVLDGVPCVFGFVGASALSARIIAWAEAGTDPDEIKDHLKDNDWSLAVFLPGRVVVYHHNSPYPSENIYPFTIGAGEDFAMGALLAKATPREAVEIAMMKNLKTGGLITELEIPRAATAMAQAAE